VVREIDRTPAQVLLRWSLQKRFITIPKSAQRQRIIENAAIFDFSLNPEHMAALDRLNEERHVTWDPCGEP
jgi:methylglyoxal/glyoxal reductase